MIAEFLDSLLSHGYLQNALITSTHAGQVAMAQALRAAL